jgi:DNA-binding GntR family transcriptional regulator/DNA-binding XRE family transcriptional regulator
MVLAMGKVSGTPEFPVGQKLRELRRSRDVTLETLAERAGLSASFLSQLERGRAGASLSSLQRIAEALEIQLSEILDPPSSPQPDVSLQRSRAGFAGTTPSRNLQARVRDAIVSGQLRPGERVSEELVAEFGDVSRSALRLTLRELHDDRLIHRTTDGSYAVSGFGPDELADVCAVRTNLEELAARRAAASASATEIAQLRRRVEHQHELLSATRALDTDAHISDDDLFHESLWLATRNRYLVEQLRPTRALIRSFGFPTVSRPDLERSIFDHLAVVEALERRDGEAAGIAMRAHHDREDALMLSARVSITYVPDPHLID